MTLGRPLQGPLEAPYPKLSELVGLAEQGDLAGLLRGLASRQDARENAEYLASVSSFSFLTENPKKTVKESEWAGDSTSGPIPENPEVLIQALIDLCKEKN